MCSFADAVSAKDWGHSNNVVAVELAQAAHVKRLVLFHHEPIFDDRMKERIHAESLRPAETTRESNPLEVIAAYDGLELTL
jgi:ribonuclease BN (tRNA processing enzyme)